MGEKLLNPKQRLCDTNVALHLRVHGIRWEFLPKVEILLLAEHESTED
jgi:hypothetical protein